jgi:hypothetical protein
MPIKQENKIPLRFRPKVEYYSNLPTCNRCGRMLAYPCQSDEDEEDCLEKFLV